MALQLAEQLYSKGIHYQPVGRSLTDATRICSVSLNRCAKDLALNTEGLVIKMYKLSCMRLERLTDIKDDRIKI